MFRYPGGKSKILKYILPKLLSYSSYEEYREPFFGGGSIGINYLLNKLSINKIWINDFDKGLSSLWTLIINNPTKLISMIKNFKPSIEKFYEFKKLLLNSNVESDEIGFMKLAIHQISYSGLGVKSGGPLGGAEQKSKYDIACRWSSDYLCKEVSKLYRLFSIFSLREKKCSSFDYECLITEDSTKALIYLDPPYFNKGKELYQFYFNENQHVKLASLLKNTSHKWVLSYDDCDFIRSLYSWANIQEIILSYSINGSRIKKELLICS